MRGVRRETGSADGPDFLHYTTLRRGRQEAAAARPGMGSPGPGGAGSYDVVVSLGQSHQVRQRDAGEIFPGHPVISLPHRQGPAAGGPGAGVGAVLQAAHRGQVPLGALQDVPQGVRLRLPGQAVSAPDAVDALNETGGLQGRHQLFNVFQRNVLPCRHLLHGDEAAVAMFRQVQEDPDGIPPFCRDHATCLLHVPPLYPQICR